MYQTIKISCCLALIISFTALAYGQDFEETGLAADALIKRLSNVRQSPTVNSAKLATLSSDTEIRVIDNTRQNGYLRVLYGNGEQGYIYYKNIKISKESLKINETENILAARTAEVPCITTGFETCLPRGCYAPNTSGALFNEAKRRLPVGTTPITLSFDDLEQMQNEIGNRLGLRSQNKPLSAAERQSLTNIRVTNGIVGESNLVKIIGFIPAIGDGLKEGAVESVNCKFREANQRDIHIPLAAQSNLTEFEGIVIEMIPQNRHPGWTLQKLKNVRRDRKKVLVLGSLFYDNDHLVNKDPAHPIRTGHSKRFSIWEIHPVTQFFVCNRIDNSCSETNMNGWIPLENIQ